MLNKAAAEFRADWILAIRSHRFVNADLVAELKQSKIKGARVE